MGNCCGSTRLTTYPDDQEYNYSHDQEYRDENYILPKIIVTSVDAALIYLDPSPTQTSNRFKNSLKRTFPTLLSSDSEKRILKQIEIMKQRRYYIIISTIIREETLKYLLNHLKVKGIYFCSEQKINLKHYSKSSKIKGFFPNQIELKKAIYYDIRLDDTYYL